LLTNQQSPAGVSWKAAREDIGNRYGFSKQRTQQIAAATSNTLRAALAKRGITSADEVFPQKDAFNLDRLPERRSAMEYKENIDATSTIAEDAPAAAFDSETAPAAAAAKRGVDFSRSESIPQLMPAMKTSPVLEGPQRPAPSAASRVSLQQAREQFKLHNPAHLTSKHRRLPSEEQLRYRASILQG